MQVLVVIIAISLTSATAKDEQKEKDAPTQTTVNSSSFENSIDKPKFEYLRLGDYIDPLKKDYPREVTKLIFVSNGGPNGDWQRPQFCPKGTFAAGYELKLEDPMWFNADDTAVNAVSLKCVRPGSQDFEGTAMSMEGPWGVWKDSVNCVNAENKDYFFVGFSLKVEKSRGIRDDTAANNVKFTCRLLNEYRHYALDGKGGPWGKWGEWSESCPMGSAVCGIQVKMHEPRGPKDDTSLNDIRLFCCNDRKDDRSRDDWIKLCDVKVHAGPGQPTRRPPRNRDRDRTGGKRRPGNRDETNGEGNRVWPPVLPNELDESTYYQREDRMHGVHPGLKEDMEQTEVFVHDFD